MKRYWPWVAAFLPIMLGLALVSVLDAFNVIEFRFTPHDIDTFIILGGVSITIILAFYLISREMIRRIEIVDLELVRREANAEHARFLRRLDHELKNPLMGIKITLENLANSTDVVQLQHIRGDIELQVARLSRLVTDLRKFADLGTQPLEIQDVQLEKLLREIEAIAREEIESETRRMNFNVSGHLPTISGDYDLLMIAIYNVVSNAIKFTRPGDKIELHTAIDGDCVVIYVADTGPGIPDEDLPYIWDELYRAHATKNIPGSGIGLALMKLIIERHRGSVSLQSRHGEGTLVTIRLPIHPDKQPDSARVEKREIRRLPVLTDKRGKSDSV